MFDIPSSGMQRHLLLLPFLMASPSLTLLYLLGAIESRIVVFTSTIVKFLEHYPRLSSRHVYLSFNMFNLFNMFNPGMARLVTFLLISMMFFVATESAAIASAG